MVLLLQDGESALDYILHSGQVPKNLQELVLSFMVCIKLSTFLFHHTGPALKITNVSVFLKYFIRTTLFPPVTSFVVCFRICLCF